MQYLNIFGFPALSVFRNLIKTCLVCYGRFYDLRMLNVKAMAMYGLKLSCTQSFCVVL